MADRKEDESFADYERYIKEKAAERAVARDLAKQARAGEDAGEKPHWIDRVSRPWPGAVGS
jgi:hypothetical protein